MGGLLLRTPRNSEEAASLKRESAKHEIVHTKNYDRNKTAAAAEAAAVGKSSPWYAAVEVGPQPSSSRRLARAL